MRLMHSLWAVALLGCVPAFAQDNKSDPPVRFVAAPGATDTKLTIDRNDWDPELVVEAIKDAKSVRIEVTELVGPVRVVPTCTVQGSASSAAAPCATPFELKAGEAKTVRLSAKLQSLGTYSAVLAVVSDSVRRNAILSVTRNASPMPVELAASVPSSATRERSLNVDVSLQEKFGTPAVLEKPALTFTRRETGKTVAEGVSLETTVFVKDQALGASWPLRGREAPVLKVEIKGIADAGEYNGRLRLTSPSSTQVLDIPIVFTKSDSAWLAGALIALGALASFFLRVYLKTVRPRIAQQRTAALLALDIEKLRTELVATFAPLLPVETAVVTRISERLTKIDRPLDEVSQAEAAAILDEVDARLSFVRRWVNARRSASRLAAPPNDVVVALSEVGAALQKPEKPDAAGLEAKLKTAEDKIASALADEIAKRVDALEAATRSSRYLDVATKARLRGQLKSAGSLLDEAERKTQLDAVESALVTAQIEGLEKELSGVATPPVGFDATTWPTLVTEVKGKLAAAAKGATLSERSMLFDAAVGHYLGKVHAALRERLAVGKQKVEQHASATKDEKDAALASIGAISTEIDSAGKEISAGHLSDAATMLAKQGTAIKDLETELGKKGLMSSAAAATGEAVPTPSPLDLEFVGLAAFSGLGLRGKRFSSLTPKGWRDLIGGLDVVVLVFALLVSVLLGLKLLWVDNATWGTVNDYVVALLWGLGLHQVSNAAFDGIGGMVDKWSN